MVGHPKSGPPFTPGHHLILPYSVLNDPRLSRLDLMVLGKIMWCARHPNRSVARMGDDYLVEQCGVKDKRSIQRSLKNLEDLKLIRRLPATRKESGAIGRQIEIIIDYICINNSCEPGEGGTGRPTPPSKAELREVKEQATEFEIRIDLAVSDFNGCLYATVEDLTNGGSPKIVEAVQDYASFMARTLGEQDAITTYKAIIVRAYRFDSVDDEERGIAMKAIRKVLLITLHKWRLGQIRTTPGAYFNGRCRKKLALLEEEAGETE